MFRRVAWAALLVATFVGTVVFSVWREANGDPLFRPIGIAYDVYPTAKSRDVFLTPREYVGIFSPSEDIQELCPILGCNNVAGGYTTQWESGSLNIRMGTEKSRGYILRPRGIVKIEIIRQGCFSGDKANVSMKAFSGSHSTISPHRAEPPSSVWLSVVSVLENEDECPLARHRRIGGNLGSDGSYPGCVGGTLGDRNRIFHVSSLLGSVVPQSACGYRKKNGGESQNCGKNHQPERIFGYRSVDVFLLAFAIAGAIIHFIGWLLILGRHGRLGGSFVFIGITIAVHAPMSLTFDFVPLAGWWRAML